MSAVEQLREAGLDADAVDRLLRLTLEEDLGERGDVTSQLTVTDDAVLDVAYAAREDGVVAGLVVLARLVELAAPTAVLEVCGADGDRVAAGAVLARLRGPARDVLALERTSLNLLGHLSGVATATRAWADAVAGTGARVRDTRKTMPLLRALQKYAVRCGGGVNHRAGLYDAVLVKDNHVAAAGGVGLATRAVVGADVVVQVEVDDLAQLDEALAAGAPQVLLDNFTLDDLRAAVTRTRDVAPGTLLEASGGLTLDRAHDVAATGVDYLAVGALTHSTRSLDIGLDHAAR
ncbi:carboxylating nicotinate-nucleotide diphosphorylase [Nocardioides aequoreus]|uniref:carboxylating nicotinate-nucleotide diphosphorylase n=1 Tax=Nocardioides aequoreus TaxID=397278 RepID=UPI0004C3B33A|nr:carboxylating nicotinate-nucleotide diphosphorylase [Nocardioides aequoreus]